MPQPSSDVSCWTDCHFHIYEPDFPVVPGAVLTPPPASVDAYRALQRSLGLGRAVVVQPSTYGTDNRLVLRVVQQLGPDRTRAVAVVADDVPDAELDRLHAGGVRGIRFNLSRPGGPGADAIGQLGRRVAERGWHVQLNTSPAVLEALAPRLLELRLPLVLDHMGHVPATGFREHPAFAALARLLDGGQAWVKLSGFYKTSAEGAPGYGDAVEMARDIVRRAPQRVVWGSDWPHPTENDKPDDAALFGLLDGIAPGAAVREAILVHNPAVLYGFPARPA